MNPWMNYHHLFYFKTIAEEGTVSKAADKLNIGQSTLSAQLKLFEQTLGINLFERCHKKLIITEQGKVALDYARHIFKMGSEMYEVLRDGLKPHRTALHIGSLGTVPKQIILQLTKEALKIAPCHITLTEGNSDELLRELTAHRIDLLVSDFLPMGIDAMGLFPNNITKKNVAIYGAKKFSSYKKGFPKSVSGLPIILPTHDSKLRYSLDHWAKVHEVEFNIIVEGEDIAMKKLLAMEGIGLLPTATHNVTSQMKSKELFKIGELQGVHEELFLIAAQRKIANAIASKLISTFKI